MSAGRGRAGMFAMGPVLFGFAVVLAVHAGLFFVGPGGANALTESPDPAGRCEASTAERELRDLAAEHAARSAHHTVPGADAAVLARLLPHAGCTAG